MPPRDQADLFEEPSPPPAEPVAVRENQPLAARMRPRSLAEFAGQQQFLGEGKLLWRLLKANRLESLIFYGPPGTGKTTLAQLLAGETRSRFRQLSAVTSGVKELREVLEDSKNEIATGGPRTLLFIDEIHRLSPVVEEYLYSAMEDYRIDIVIDKGPGARSIQLNINPFTLVGATTRSGLLTSPLRARFGINCHLEYYDQNVINHIIKRSARLLNCVIEDNASFEIARRSRGTPRIANALLRRVRDFAMVKGNGTIDMPISLFALDAMGIDKYGLDDMDHKVLTTLIDKFEGGPVGLSSIATAIGEDKETIEEVYEPFLIKEGFIKRTPRGRVATTLAYTHLNRSIGYKQSDLFSNS